MFLFIKVPLFHVINIYIYVYICIILSIIISSLSLSTVAHASLFIQNISVTICSIVLMLVFSYKKWIEEIWDGWLTVSPCYIVS